MSVVTGRDEVCKKISDALGIKHCLSLDLHMSFDDIVSVRAKFYPDRDDMMKLIPILKKYKLVERKEQICQE